MTPTKAPIAIIGAGPAGLLLARLLELADIPYVVFDRDESAAASEQHSSGGTLDVHRDSGQLALNEAGLRDEFKALARYDVPIKIADAQGNVLTTVSGNGEGEAPEIDRRALRNLLLGSIPASKIHWGCKVQQIQKEDDGSLSVYVSHGLVESGFRLVVGADGAWSKIRKLVSTTPFQGQHQKQDVLTDQCIQVTPATPQYSGTHFFTSLIKPGIPVHPSATSMAGRGNYLALMQSRQIFLHFLGDGSYHLSVGMKLPEFWSSSSSSTATGPVLNPNSHDPSTLWQSLLQAEFAEWSPALTDLVKFCDGNFRSWPLYSLAPGSLPWTAKQLAGVTLLGDAAHPT